MISKEPGSPGFFRVGIGSWFYREETPQTLKFPLKSVLPQKSAKKQKNIRFFLHGPRITPTMASPPPSRCFRETGQATGAGGWSQTCGQTPGIPCQGQTGGTRFPRRERPFTAFGQGEAKRSIGHCLSRSGRIIHGPVWARHGLSKRHWQPCKCGTIANIIPETCPHLRVLSGLTKMTHHGRSTPRERRSVSEGIP
ncbi:hypothetical protein GGQ73_001166 [Rhizobium skierniewicense]|uniref:Uncharacterized protein n=1 Tax=Rhizobium skierniewicense TaxID=984260 RepID=A0A7W6C3U3_9HYPH|nr:hypothetical protein [Rhizobium skierniewicense]